MKSWELDEIFLLVSSVFKENDLCNFWEAEKDLLLDQLIVRRVTSLHFQEEVIKEDAQEPQIDRSDLWLVKYDELALKTNNIPLSHLSCCRWKP